MNIPGNYDQVDGDVSPAPDVAVTPDPSTSSAIPAPPPDQLAHDIAHLANIVGNLAHLLALQAGDPAAVRRHADSLADVATRGAELADRLARLHGRSQEQRRARARARPVAGVADRTLRVLVVEDEPVGRDLLRTILETAGHSVTVATGLYEAVRALEAPDVELDALITDVGLDDGSGWELVRIAREHSPNLRIGVVTGWGNVANHPNAARADFVVGKPFRLDELLAHLNA